MGNADLEQARMILCRLSYERVSWCLGSMLLLLEPVSGVLGDHFGLPRLGTTLQDAPRRAFEQVHVKGRVGLVGIHGLLHFALLLFVQH